MLLELDDDDVVVFFEGLELTLFVVTLLVAVEGSSTRGVCFVPPLTLDADPEAAFEYIGLIAAVSDFLRYPLTTFGSSSFFSSTGTASFLNLLLIAPRGMNSI